MSVVKEEIIYVVTKESKNENDFLIIYAGTRKDFAFALEPDEYYNMLRINVMYGELILKTYEKAYNKSKFDLIYDLSKII